MISVDIRDVNATVISAVVEDHMPDALLVTIMTALCESDLYNYSNPLIPISVLLGDRLPPKLYVDSTLDSLGIFQQRTRWWGTGSTEERVRQLMSPPESTRLFLAALNDVPHWRDLPPWEACQAVQRSSVVDGSNYRERLEQAQRVIAGGVSYFTNGGI